MGLAEGLLRRCNYFGGHVVLPGTLDPLVTFALSGI